MLITSHTSFLSIIFLVLSSTVTLSSSSLTWKTASEDFLRRMYSEFDFCVLMQRKYSSTCLLNDSIEKERKCSALTVTKDTSFLLPQSMLHSPAPSYPLFSSLNNITGLFLKLNESNRAMVLVGDSITRNSIEALMCILSLENAPNTVQILPPLKKILYNVVHYKIFIDTIMVHLVYVSMWHSYQHGVGGTTTMMTGELQRILFNDQYPKLNAIMVFNIGIHERGFRPMKTNLMEMFLFSKKLYDTFHRNITFLYRETSVQHYDTTAGMFNKKIAQKMHENISQTCKEWSIEDREEYDWRYAAEQSALKSSLFDKRNIISFREISKHFWDVHRASPYFKIQRNKINKRQKGYNEDCTHFIPPASPVLYRMLWTQILSH